MRLRIIEKRKLIKSISTIFTEKYIMLKYKHCFYGALTCGKFVEDGHLLDLLHNEKTKKKYITQTIEYNMNT